MTKYLNFSAIKMPSLNTETSNYNQINVTQ